MEKPTERGYCSMNCGNCYRGAVAIPARFFTCTQCGAPAFECSTFRDEMQADAS